MIVSRGLGRGMYVGAIVAVGLCITTPPAVEVSLFQDTTQGSSAHRFVPARSAEVRIALPWVDSGGATLQPVASATARTVSRGAYGGLATLYAQSGALAVVEPSKSASGVGALTPHATAASATIFTRSVSVGAAQVAPFAGAQADVLSTSALAHYSELQPFGVQNPTDEELIALIVAARRTRILDSNTS